MKIIAVVPARSGSRGLADKNIRKLEGHPLMAYSIAAGLESKLVDRVICSTDSEKYAKIARRYGAEVPVLRPKRIAGSKNSDLQFLQHLLCYLIDKENYFADLVVLLRPTSPIRKRGLVDKAIRKLQRSIKSHSLRTVTQAPITPYKMWKNGEEEFMSPLLGSHRQQYYNSLRQELPQVWFQTGSVDVIRASTVLEMGSSSGTKILGLKVPRSEYCDIDCDDDFLLAQMKLKSKTVDIVRPG